MKQNNIIWCDEFRKACQNEYKGLNHDQRQLFTLIKDADLTGLKKFFDECESDAAALKGNSNVILKLISKQADVNEFAIQNWISRLLLTSRH